MRRLLAWLAVVPFGASGVLVAHALAYRLTGTPGGASHDYLEHAPQLLAFFVVAALGLTALVGRRAKPSSWQFAVAAPVAFAAQEHLEQAVHTGHVPWLLTTPVFLVGLLLQVPVSLLGVALVRRLLGAVVEPVRIARPQIHGLILFFCLPTELCVTEASAPFHPARGPPPPGMP